MESISPYPDTDENECKRPVCTFPSLCRNTVGSYACDCPEGYENKGRKDSARCEGMFSPFNTSELSDNTNLPFNNCMGCKVGQASFENTETSKKGKTQLENYHSRDNMYAEVNLFVYKMKVSMKMFKLLKFDLFNFSKAQDKLNAGC